jgi:predicted HicB family RNase H-like nuclease
VKSGKFIVRVPVSLHEALAQRAREDNCSVNLLVNTFLAAALEWKPWEQRVDGMDKE